MAMDLVRLVLAKHKHVNTASEQIRLRGQLSYRIAYTLVVQHAWRVCACALARNLLRQQ